MLNDQSSSSVGSRRRRPLVDDAWRRLLAGSFPTIARPLDTPRAEVAGADPVHILLLGSGAAAGWGVDNHRLALAGQLAEALSGVTGDGVVVDALVSTSMTASSAAEVLDDAVLDRYDAIVVSIGLTDALRLAPVRTFRRRVRALLTTLEECTMLTTRIILVGIQPVRSIPAFDNPYGALAGAHAAHLNAVLRELSDEHPKASFTPLPAPPAPPAGHHRTPADYRYWAQAVSGHLAMRVLPLRPDRHGILNRAPGELEAARITALHDLRLLDTGPEARFDRIVALARSVFDTRFAALTLVDDDRQWMKSAAGMDPVSMPRDQSYCQFTIRDIASTIIPDSRREARTRELTSTKQGFVFYAGYPLRAPTGHLVGALCVFDTEPRERSTVDTQLLHDLAMLAQRELWQSPQQVASRASF